MSLEDKIKHLNSVRIGYVGRVTYFDNRLKKEDDLEEDDLEMSMRALDELTIKYDQVEADLRVLVNNDNAIDKASDNFYEKFFAVKLKYAKLLKDFQRADPSKTSTNVPNTTISVKLPEIEIPKFDGSYINWLSFKDRFTDLIHNEKSILNSVKFHYLVSGVSSGKAYQYIKHIPITNDNYDQAWKILLENYDNEVAIQKSFIKSLFDIKKPQEHNHEALQRFLDEITQNITALSSFSSIDISNWHYLLVHHFTEKLDNVTKIEVIKKSTDKHLTLDEFLNILKKRIIMMKAVKSEESQVSKSSSSSKKDVKKVFVSNDGNACPYCNANDHHNLPNCPKFTNSSVMPKSRYKSVKRLKLCKLCLNGMHSSFNCRAPSCSICKKPHHRLLHFGDTSSPSTSNNDIAQTSNVSTASTSNKNVPSNDEIVVGSSVNEHSQRGQVLLATAIVLARSNTGQLLHCRALLDSGSQSHFITERFCRLLKLPKTSRSTAVSGISRSSVMIDHSVNVHIQSRISGYSIGLQCLVLPKITGNRPNQPINIDVDAFPTIEFADPTFCHPSQIDLLIGAEVYHDIVKGRSSFVIDGLPPFYDSEFGLISIGRLPSRQLNHVSSNCVKVNSLHCSLDTLNDRMSKFWEIDQIDVPNHYSLEEKMCEDDYVSHVSRDLSGRYSVALPLTTKIVDLGDSHARALKQFEAIERKLSKNTNLHQEYVAFMQEYLALNHMELVKDVDLVDSQCNKDFFLPHHAVIRESSSTTKVRVVFNASALTTSNISLNDCLLNGPIIQQDLFSIVVRFRKHQFVFTGDIAKMYRQIEVKAEYRDLQRIWWRDSPDQELKCYRLRTVTYGTASAPYLAIRTLKQLAIDEGSNYPESSKVLLRDFYVDDVLTGGATEEDALYLKNNLTELLSKGGFELRKFQSNSPLLSDHVDGDVKNENPISILGLFWKTDEDNLVIKFPQYKHSSACTKRSVLSEIAQLYDPLGLVAPMVFTAKVFMQSIWSKSDIQWDSELPIEMSEFWREFKSQTIELSKLSVPRCFLPKLTVASIELHGYADASDKGYGCCVYTRVKCSDGRIIVNLLCAKSRVSPLKKSTTPRLELCAAVLLVQLMNRVNNVIDINFDAQYYWSDSEITLFRIRSVPSKFAVFVANRISMIQELSDPKNWFYVPTALNPADIVSRGLMPSDMINKDLWFHGPNYLYKERTDSPCNPNNKINIDLLELRKNEVLESTHVVESSWDIFNRFSSYAKLLRVISWCRRFAFNCRQLKTNRKYDDLSVGEIDDSLKCLVKYVQQLEFKDDIEHLKQQKSVSTKSKLLRLSPFIDDEMILRVGGRLHNSAIPFDQKHPMLLPKSHPFCLLVVRNEHLHRLHAGVQALMSFLRFKYWILDSRNLCKKIVRECMMCFRYRAQTMKQIMGQLPSDRVNPSRVFSRVGIDFCGPFTIVHQLKKKVSSKVYVCVFVCFAVKAIHIEVVSDLSTQGFIMALRRFASRRGAPSYIFSDNATNFVGAKNELSDLNNIFVSELNQAEIKRYCENEGIQWRLIPPLSSHFGGIWEAAVKSAKFHLKRVLGNNNFTYEYLETMCTQVETILNSRPLMPLSDDPNDMQCLTPGHFLIGSPLISLPDPSLKHLNFNKLANFQKIQFLTQEFWTRWSNEYLSQLNERNKWQTPTENIRVGSLVLLKEDNTPPLSWNLGRVLDVHYGKDGFARVVTIKTEKNILKRAIAKVCLLPIPDNFEEFKNNIVN